MTSCSNAAELLNREFLTVRAKLLEIAAALDRVGRGVGPVEDNPAENNPQALAIRQALEVLADKQPGKQSDRAEQIQLIFSRGYDDQWRDRLLTD